MNHSYCIGCIYVQFVTGINIMFALNNSVPHNAVSMVTDIYVSFVLGMIIRMNRYSFR